MENEIWKDVKGYEGYYQVSNMGRVKSMRVLKTPKNGVKCRKNTFLSTKTSHDKQYILVALCRDGERKQVQVHRLVAEVFIPNPKNLPFVNHKDENPSNNCADNLEWCTHEYNLRYSLELHGMKKPRKHQAQESKPRKRPDYELVPICAYTLSGEFIAQYNSVWEAIEKLGIESKTPRGVRNNIRMCCKGKVKTANGYIWRYKGDAAPQKNLYDKNLFVEKLRKLLLESNATISAIGAITITINGKSARVGRNITANNASRLAKQLSI